MTEYLNKECIVRKQNLPSDKWTDVPSIILSGDFDTVIQFYEKESIR